MTVIMPLLQLWSAICMVLMYYIYRTVPEPYMDEIFHVRQTQQYCDGDYYTWDPKITTLPGMYFAMLGFSRITKLVATSWLSLPESQLCSLAFLRLGSVLFGTLNLALVMLLLKSTIPKSDLSRKTLTSKLKLILASMTVVGVPFLWFFQFLFYTDQASLFFLLASYYFARKALPLGRGPWLSAWTLAFSLASGVFGAYSVFVRQTNVLWVAFIVVSVLIERWRPTDAGSTYTESNVATSVLQFAEFCIVHFRSICLLFWPHLLVAIGFTVFLFKNGSITVGDKQAHEAVFHYPQFLYFLVVAATCTAWEYVSVSHAVYLVRKTKNLFFGGAGSMGLVFRWILLGALIAGNLWLIKNFTYAHLYLISDNRHYTFYIWQRTLGKFDSFKFAMLPLYFLSGLSLWKLLDHKTVLWRVALAAVSFAVLVPAALIEFRYFITPIVFILLNLKPVTSRSLLAVIAQLATFAAVNAATVYLFIEKPFTGPDRQTGRFMW